MRYEMWDEWEMWDEMIMWLQRNLPTSKFGPKIWLLWKTKLNPQIVGTLYCGKINNFLDHHTGTAEMCPDQPNLVLDSGTRPSLDSFCHHQIIYCKVNFRIPSPPPFERKILHFNRANSVAIKRSMTTFPWHQHLNINPDPNWQVKTFTNIFLNIMSNFIPNETKRFIPRNPPWITKPLKTMLNRKNRLFKNYKRHGYKADDRVRLDAFRIECQEAV